MALICTQKCTQWEARLTKHIYQQVCLRKILSGPCSAENNKELRFNPLILRAMFEFKCKSKQARSWWPNKRLGQNPDSQLKLHFTVKKICDLDSKNIVSYFFTADVVDSISCWHFLWSSLSLDSILIHPETHSVIKLHEQCCAALYPVTLRTLCWDHYGTYIIAGMASCC